MKLLSLFLALLLSLSCLTGTGFAAEGTAQTTEAAIPEGTAGTQVPDASEPRNPLPDSTVIHDAGLDATGSLTGPQHLEVEAEAVLLLEMESDTMVYAKNIDVRREPASLTKVMTCLLALERGNLADTVTVSAEAIAEMDPSGSNSGLLAGEVFTLEQLLYCLMIESANDAAPVIAEHIAGSEAAFVQLMNQKARELGCTDTNFANTHGLHDDNHYTTARDLAKIMRAALEYEKFQEIYATARYEIPATNLSEARLLVTTNYLIDTSVTQDYYDDRVIGGKTGFTTPAGRCVMFTAEDNGLAYLCVILGASNIVTDTYTIYGSFRAASQVLDFGFENFLFAEVLSPLSPLAQLPVKDATESVVVTPLESITTMLPQDYDETKLITTYELLSETGLEAPLEAGEKVGVVRQYYGDICVGETDLVTVTAVERLVLAAAVNETVAEISASPWRFVVIVLSVLLGLLLVFLLTVTILRCRNCRRRRRRSRR